MENKINIAELLKDCPKGMELDCTMYDNLYVNQIYDDGDCIYEIGCYTIVDEIKTPVNFTKFGTFNTHANSKCVIFPKGKTTWEGFTPPCKFKDGDIISNDMYIAIFYKADRPYTDFKRDVLYYHCWYNRKYNEFKVETDYGIGHIEGYKLATEEEKEKLFNVIKANGYKWNDKTKTLKKLIVPMFKVGDKIKKKRDTRLISIKDVRDNYYIITIPDYFDNNYITGKLLFSNQDDYELITNKFDITTLKAFDKVLVRDSNESMWSASIFSHTWKNKYICIGIWYNQCIPYEENKHLLGTTNDCDDFYKTWE